MLRLIVGLGNPGMEYDGSRHNAGFAWVDAAAAQLRAALRHERAYHGMVARVDRPTPGSTGPLWLLQPQTYMNLSGKAVSALARFYKIAPEEILVVHDELDLLPGQVKLKQGGGAAGHNGLKDILAHLGGPSFWRLRLGIGHPGDRAEVANWVLRRAPAEERDATQQCIDRTLQALPLLIEGPMERAMMKIHAKPPSEQRIAAKAASDAARALAPAPVSNSTHRDDA